MVRAVAFLTGTADCNGTVKFSQQGNGPTTAEVDLSEFSPGRYKLYVHIHGDITNRSNSTGIRFKKLGAITVFADGKGHLKHDYKEITLSLSEPNSIIGRALVVRPGKRRHKPHYNHHAGDSGSVNVGDDVVDNQLPLIGEDSVIGRAAGEDNVQSFISHKWKFRSRRPAVVWGVIGRAA